MAGYTIGNIIRKNRLSRGNPDKIAVVFGDRRLTYAELDDRVNRLASALERQGFERGQRMAILSKNRIEWLEAFFAVVRLGGAVVPINYFFKPPELRHALADCEVDWLFIEEDLLDTYRPVESETQVRVVVTGVEQGGLHEGELDFDELLAGGDPAGVDVLVGLDEPVLFQYTSGTTGFPKAAIHTHGGLLFNTVTQPYDLDMRRDDVYLSVPALCWAAGLHDYLLSGLWIGATIVLNPSRALDCDALCASIEREKATIIVLAPSVMRLLLASDALERHDVSSLRVVMTGAEPITAETLDELAERVPGCAVLQGYGQSEFPIFTSVLMADEARTKTGSAGKSTSLCELRVVDEHGQETPTGVEGAIVSRSPATMIGYFQRDRETTETIVDGWLQTGDRGYVDEDGYLYIAGRSKDMLITGGLNVYPAEVERIITDFPGVAESAIIGVPDEKYGEVGCAFVVPEPGAEVDLGLLRTTLKEHVSNYKVPRQWRLRDEPLPRTASGKIRKFLLKEDQIDG
ncbi:hypothetical protein BHE97_16280 [Aeromicrobium sp. PE09-221]|uniref:class I adenylate-forming enzyme family protein n=1 Tax=Aeromicrobium sp. PE09-221 TaxID=1898043 RepID=UPI000B3E56AF|nr:AMP-binding protein [Aeromicrobium sp. PE09-221]OUZ07653.1 hypothetical protein BHE97_16280 [Aeromicrobium sp. PE09-221]